MNYIKKIEAENKIIKSWIADLDRYVNSDKFRYNVMVNKADINLRLSELRTKLFREGLSL